VPDAHSLPEAASAGSADAGILGRLLLVQTTLHVLPRLDGIGVFLCEGLRELPGLAGMAVCIGGRMVGRVGAAPECARAAVAESCDDLLAAADRSVCASCPVVRPPTLVRLPFSTVSASYGWLVLALAPPQTFAPYLPHVQNVANLVATILENRCQRQQLLEGQRELARRVEERTADLARAHEELAQARKLESIGRLAGGIAHDFNNLLTAILGYTELAETLDPTDATAECLGEIRAAGKRAADLTHQLLTFARRQVVAPKSVSPNALVGDLAGMLRRLIGEHIQLTTRLEPVAWRVMVDPGQFTQVLTNLAVNARDAMPSGGRLVIATRNVTFAADAAWRPDGAAGGDFVAVEVADSGVGMSDEVRRRVFEPFFTTKPVGHGTGLGLATCYGIVKQSGGDIRVESRPGEGTSFTIFLPRTAAEAETTTDERPGASHVAGRETILLAEDEPAIRRLAASALRKAGYHVLEAANGREATELAAHHNGPIDAVITDVVMPEMGGLELAVGVRRLGHRARVLYMSGYPEAAASSVDPADSVLAKPFAPTALLHSVRSLLDRQ
jgi:signal transduction histidine kinase